MNNDIWLKEDKTGEDLLLCLQSCVEEEHWFEIDEKNSKVLYDYIINLKQALIDIRELVNGDPIKVGPSYIKIGYSKDEILQIIDKMSECLNVSIVIKRKVLKNKQIRV